MYLLLLFWIRRLRIYLDSSRLNLFCQLQTPVEEWPICDCLISFHSKGFPLDKAIQYEKLRKPYVINNLHMQYDIQVIKLKSCFFYPFYMYILAVIMYLGLLYIPCINGTPFYFFLMKQNELI